MEINQGYPGGDLSRTRRKFIEQIHKKQEQRRDQITGGYCIIFFLLFVCVVLAFVAYLIATGQIKIF